MKRQIVLVCVCNHEDCHELKVTTINIEEDASGADVITFICPFCGQEHKSKRYIR